MATAKTGKGVTFSEEKNVSFAPGFNKTKLEADTSSADLVAALSLIDTIKILSEKVKADTATDEEKSALVQHTQTFSGLLNNDDRVRSAFIKSQGMDTVWNDVVDVQLSDARSAMIMVVCFVIDATISMQPWIETVQAQVKGIATQYANWYGNGNLRLSCVVYRDHGLKEPLSSYSFDSNLGRFQAFIDSQKASTQEVDSKINRDEPEDVTGGLDRALALDWDCAGPNVSKVLIHIADAPNHGKRYNGGLRDNFPDLQFPCRDPVAILNGLKQKSIHYFFGRIKSDTDQMIKSFNEDVNQNWIQTVSMEDVTKVAETVLKTMSSSVLKTFSASGGGALGHADMSTSCSLSSQVSSHLDDVETTSLPEPASSEVRDHCALTWDVSNAKKLHLTSCAQIHRTSQLQQRFPFVTCNVMNETFKCMIDTIPFADGATRWAFHGQVQCGSRAWQNYVFKRSKRIDRRAWSTHTRNNYIEQIKGVEIAIFLAEAWNKAKPSHCKVVNYLPAFVAEVEVGSSQREYYCMEPLLPEGVFTKFNNNAGLWDASSADETILRFAKFTYDITKGYMMVADLQGMMKSDGSYMLTDPVILCKDTDLFLPTNLGTKAQRANKLQIDRLLEQIEAKKK